jgi:hypothetical protein
MKAWEYYITREDLATLHEELTSEISESRRISLESLEEVALRASAAYEHLDSAEEVQNAIIWDATNLVEYSATGVSEEAEDLLSRYTDLLPAGHPAAADHTLESRALWASGAPELDELSREAVLAAMLPTEDKIQELHATARVRAMIASGKLTSETAKLIYLATETD